MKSEFPTCEKLPSPGKAFAKVCRIGAGTCAEFAMLAPGDRVLVGLSGGLDSFVLLELLKVLQKKVPFAFSLEAATFDGGFPGFHADKVHEYCEQNNILHHVISLDLKPLLLDVPGERKRRPCVRCSRLRRGKLYGLARERKISKLALGHHADDILSSFLISLVRGQGLTTMGPNVPADRLHERDAEWKNNEQLRIIRPLARLPEALVKQAAKHFEFPAAGECIYKEELAASGDRAWAVAEIARWAQRIPDLRTLMLKSLSDVHEQWLLDRRFLRPESEINIP